MQTKWIAFSVRIYRALLILYPADYRHEFGALMVQMFRDVSRDKFHKQGVIGVAFWWCATLLDLTFTVIEQRRKGKFTMSRATFIQSTGILLMVGGFCGAVAAFSQFQPDDHYTYYGVYQLFIWLFAPSFLLIGLGNIGLALRIDGALGTLGQWTLYLSALGALGMSIGIVASSIDGTLWNLWLGSGILHTIALTAFGLLHLRKPVLPIFRALPLQIASGWVFMLAGIHNLFPQPTNNLLAFLMFFGMGVAWLAIGMVMHRQQKSAALSAA
jgi:hypothetical protein